MYKKQKSDKLTVNLRLGGIQIEEVAATLTFGGILTFQEKSEEESK